MKEEQTMQRPIENMIDNDLTKHYSENWGFEQHESHMKPGFQKVSSSFSMKIKEIIIFLLTPCEYKLTNKIQNSKETHTALSW
jgi:hypothetical protein